MKGDFKGGKMFIHTMQGKYIANSFRDKGKCHQLNGNFAVIFMYIYVYTCIHAQFRYT